MTRFLIALAATSILSLPACASPPTDTRPNVQQSSTAQRKCPCATLDADELNVIGADAIAKRNEHAQAAQVYDTIIRDLQGQINPAAPMPGK